MKNFILFQNVYKSQGGTVIKIYTIYPEIYDFYDEDDTNWHRRNRQRKLERVLQFYGRPQTGKYKTGKKIRQSNLVHLLWREERVGGSKKHKFSAVKPSAYSYFRRSKKEKWRIVQNKSATLIDFQRSIPRLLKICWMKTSLNFLNKFQNLEESIWKSNMEKEIIFGTRSFP